MPGSRKHSPAKAETAQTTAPHGMKQNTERRNRAAAVIRLPILSRNRPCVFEPHRCSSPLPPPFARCRSPAPLPARYSPRAAEQRFEARFPRLIPHPSSSEQGKACASQPEPEDGADQPLLGIAMRSAPPDMHRIDAYPAESLDSCSRTAVFYRAYFVLIRFSIFPIGRANKRRNTTFDTA